MVTARELRSVKIAMMDFTFQLLPRIHRFARRTSVIALTVRLQKVLNAPTTVFIYAPFVIMGIGSIVMGNAL